MRRAILSLVLGAATLAGLLTLPSEAEARRRAWRRGYAQGYSSSYATPGYVSSSSVVSPRYAMETTPSYTSGYYSSNGYSSYRSRFRGYRGSRGYSSAYFGPSYDYDNGYYGRRGLFRRWR
jgi:hypothetical protein